MVLSSLIVELGINTISAEELGYKEFINLVEAYVKHRLGFMDDFEFRDEVSPNIKGNTSIIGAMFHYLPEEKKGPKGLEYATRELEERISSAHISELEEVCAVVEQRFKSEAEGKYSNILTGVYFDISSDVKRLEDVDVALAIAERFILPGRENDEVTLAELERYLMEEKGLESPLIDRICLDLKSYFDKRHELQTISTPMIIVYRKELQEKVKKRKSLYDAILQTDGHGI